MRLTEFLPIKTMKSCEKELLNKNYQLVTVKDDKRKFKIIFPSSYSKTMKTSSLTTNYTMINEMINDPEVFLSIKDENKKIQIYIYKTAITMYWKDRFHQELMLPTAPCTKGQSLVFDGNFLLKPSNWKPMTLQQGTMCSKLYQINSMAKCMVSIS